MSDAKLKSRCCKKVALPLGLAVLMAGSLASGAAWAKFDAPTRALHQAPDQSSPVLEQVGAKQPLVKIYARSDGWIKVGDPKDGTVGWLAPIKRLHPQKARLNQPVTKVTHTPWGTKTVTHGVIKTASGPMQYQIVEFNSTAQNQSHQPGKAQAAAKPSPQDIRLAQALQRDQVVLNQAFADSWRQLNQMQAQMDQFARTHNKQINQLLVAFNQSLNQAMVPVPNNQKPAAKPAEVKQTV